MVSSESSNSFRTHNKNQDETMKIKTYIALLLVIIAFVSCFDGGRVSHRGEKTMAWTLSAIDSIVINDDSASWSGSYFDVSDKLGFFDEKTNKVSLYNWKTGNLIKRALDKGHARNELADWSVASGIIGDKDKIAIYSANIFLIYDIKKDTLINYGFVNFGYGSQVNKPDYESPVIYKVCYMDIFRVDSNTVMFPLAHNHDSMEGWYENSHIWGYYNYEEKKFTKLVGNLPEYYYHHPVPLFERFASCKMKDKYVTTHVLDSMIYVHGSPDNTSYSFGYEANNADRIYHCKENDMFDATNAMKDDDRMTKNVSLLYSESLNCILRTCVTGSGDNSLTTVQLYDMETCDLVAEKNFPGMLDFIHCKENVFYGVNTVPHGTENYIYTFKVRKP